MNSNEIRQSFLDFFKSKQHKIVPSAPVVPFGDPTLLFINAGMNQFKDVFLGTGKRDYSRAADTQKCIRVSGKHNDLEEVGVDTYHHTFFEMLGNWSFGDYYKKEAIEWAWELLVDVWKLAPDRLFATVYKTDEEAYELWKRFLPEDRIFYFDDKDNFWEMGNTGPCGPCSEIHYDLTPDKSGANLVNAGSPEVIEIWNLVFIQYNRKEDSSLEELKSKHVDTGMGFERITAVIQGKNSNYDTDVFMPLIEAIEKESGQKYSKELNNPTGIAMRVIADHVRTLAFAISDGALPGNEGRSYVLRRILRRGSRFARNLGFREPVMYKLVSILAGNMGSQFPELIEQKETIEKVIKGEEESFLKTLDRGLELFEQIRSELTKQNKTEISGEDAFKLTDTFGFPIDLTQLIARENGFTVDMAGFEKHMTEQKERSRAARKDIKQEVEMPAIDEKTIFEGYVHTSLEAKVLLAEGNKIVLDRTPFYVESGGQISDKGTIVMGGEEYEVEDVKKSGDAIIHFCTREVEELTGTSAIVKIDKTRRNKIRKNHSATHLLHQALREILGDHVKQAGSLVAPDYLRFDFNHFEKVNDEQIRAIEKLVNKKIFEGHNVDIKEMPIEEAQKDDKIKMFFGDKYGDVVRVISMDPNYSKELCGGTHVANTSEIGIFKITSESSVAAGVRRIEAVTAEEVYDYINNLNEQINSEKLEISELHIKIKKLEKELKQAKVQQMSQSSGSITDDYTDVNGIKVIAKKFELDNMDELKGVADNMRAEMKSSGVALLAMENEGKVQLVCVSTDDIMKKLPAGKLVGAAAKILGGGGGGRPHMATAGGKDTSKLDDMLKSFPDIVKEMM
jgi:alanyl-tRNA synthetase